MFVKICGIRDKSELGFVEGYADASGVVVRAESKRRISLEKAREIISVARIPIFAVSTESRYEGWMEIIEKTGTKHIQIHSDMNLKEYEKLRNDFDGIITKTFIITKRSYNPEEEAEKMLEEVSLYDADFFLFDTGKGSGRLHDLRVTKEICKKVDRAILAGGLNPVNVRGIIEFVKPFGVDVSSGVENNGRKDPSLIKDFIEVIK